MPDVGDDQHRTGLPVAVEWRGGFAAAELDALFVDMVRPQPLTDGSMPRFRLLDDYGWHRFLDEHTIGWVVARDPDGIVGFATIASSDAAPASLADVLVATRVDRARVTEALARTCAGELAVAVSNAGVLIEPPPAG